MPIPSFEVTYECPIPSSVFRTLQPSGLGIGMNPRMNDNKLVTAARKLLEARSNQMVTEEEWAGLA